LIKFGESFSLGSIFNQSQTYQGNPCGVYPDLFSFTGSGVYPDLSFFTGSDVIQIFIACIKRSVPSQDHIKYLDKKKLMAGDEVVFYFWFYDHAWELLIRLEIEWEEEDIHLED